MKAEKLAGWRRIADAIWDPPNDPQIYGMLEVDASRVLDFVDAGRAHGVHVTPTHLVGRAIARALAAVPDLNVRLVSGRAIPRRSVDVFFITAVAKGKDLTGVKIEEAELKSAYDIAVELDARSNRMKAGNDPDLARAKRFSEQLPRPLLRVALRATAWLVGERNRSIPALGLAAAPFGSVMVSSVGMLGIPIGFSPLVWMYHVPLLILAGEIKDKPVVEDGHIVIRPILPITATVDHRYVDGAHLAAALRAFQQYLADPFAFEPSYEAATPTGPQSVQEHLQNAQVPAPPSSSDRVSG